jgi:hypothetical protein
MDMTTPPARPFRERRAAAIRAISPEISRRQGGGASS